MQTEVKDRGIKYLWHFTKLENLESILENGLIPRSDLEALNANVSYNDEHRYDGQKSANCLSLGHPNYKMFYKLRQDDTNQEWVVIAIKPEVLWIKDCAFCRDNAASNDMTAIPVQKRKGVDAFREMFAAYAGKPDRKTLDLPDDCPTNPQAEILAFGVIEPEYIIGAITPGKSLETKLKEKYPNFDFLYHRAYYSARKDYEYW
ncbi:hypothetical protein TUMSATVNIG1_17930 [Vibrio nigripulchritudo]|uniref:DarT ssDNA thymidine ADP-ribosyltransferase family protein n=1 Tax=Vibrio nigripulchritudo TaxID=28173 RepID=UPI00190A63A9|nr:DarT ssDNA thymidine ADP-ribosyltransferase family protein [Vibrio nigripulchritudo]BCL69838.1 hypothetical protein VNTUMSATTG_17750 [Vibrio nigripulchritudo]BDU31184.1 hypothetical protein TUMSATVNIG1_17930 [Vibrio nigripulchritudo]